LLYDAPVIAIRLIGQLMLSFVTYLGELALLCASIGESLRHGRKRLRLILQQIAEIGYRSQPVVMVTGAFTGAVLTAQSLFQFSKFGMETMGGALVSVAMLRELGPVVTGLMLAGRVGASMAAEIGTMKVTEQIDALRVMNVSPIDYLVTPRLLAMLLAIPLLIGESAALGIIAANVVGIEVFGIGEAYWKYQMQNFTDLTDVAFSLIKGGVFGIIIIVVSCHQGLQASQGAAGVGRGTTRAMVYSSLLILVANFFLTLLLNLIFPAGARLG
jgi:phospholipid/cholesterol/gamma-HCH transport system permease protein